MVKHISKYYYLYCIFNQINAALVSILTPNFFNVETDNINVFIYTFYLKNVFLMKVYNTNMYLTSFRQMNTHKHKSCVEESPSAHISISTL